MSTTSHIASREIARAVVATVAQGAAAGAGGGLVFPHLFPGIAALIAAQADGVLAYGLIFFMCVQIGVAASIMFAALDQCFDGGQS